MLLIRPTKVPSIVGVYGPRKYILSTLSIQIDLQRNTPFYASCVGKKFAHLWSRQKKKIKVEVLN